ncbi:MAG TPA: serine/threonine-protein kinase [Candidatus Nanoarchaeia archaeon]|nr:serine/threonine-protein kinase [Candidatus Nanoarchaeia archaeon]
MTAQIDVPSRVRKTFLKVKKFRSHDKNDFYGARDEDRKRVIIKEFSERESFQREKTIQELLAPEPKHENILYALAWSDASRTITYPFAQGGNVGRVLERAGKCTPEQAVRIASPLCKAVSVLHAKGIIHRDIKPENLFLQRTEYLSYLVKLSDYDVSWHESIASSYKEGLIYGTPYYMAPEVIKGNATDPRSDIYAIGVTLYVLVTDHFPFGEGKKHLVRVMGAHLTDPVPNAARYNYLVTPGFQYVLEKSMAKNPNKRFQTAEDLEQELSAIVENGL